MVETRRLGLSGKARRVRARNRATRLNARRMIQEYLEPEGTDRMKDRYIPIRHSTTFRPTVAMSKPVGPSKLIGPRIMGRVEAEADRRRDAAAWRVPCPAPGRPREKALRLSCASRRDHAATMARAAIFGPRPRRAFRLSGFLFGCALGTAAASVLLICVRSAIG